MAANMSTFVYSAFEGIAYRFTIQCIVFLAVGLVTLKAWQHYCRNPYSFSHYTFLSFVFFLIQCAVKLGVYFLRLFDIPVFSEAVMPMLNHILQMGWVILFLYAFIVTISGIQFIKQYFLIANLFLMVFISSTVWLNWLHYLDTTNPGQSLSGYFWGELVLEVWIMLLLVFGLFFARRLHSAIRGCFLLAVYLLTSRQLIHCWIIINSHKPLLWTFVVDRMILLSFSVVTLVSVYSYGKIAKGGNGDAREFLQRDSSLVRDEK